MSRAQSLSALYVELNRSHFGGWLEKYRVRRVPLTGTTDAVGITWYGKNRIDILRGILGDFTPGEERVILLHEMCHVATKIEVALGLDHGPLWRLEMLRLAAEHGEAWAAECAARYEKRADRAAERTFACKEIKRQIQHKAKALKVKVGKLLE